MAAGQLRPVLVVLLLLAGSSSDLHAKGEGARRFFFTLDPQMSVKDILPIPPKSPKLSPVLITNLADVPEVHFQDPFTVPPLPERGKDKISELLKGDFSAAKKRRPDATEKELEDLAVEVARERLMAQERIAYQMARINLLNSKKTDHFLETLLAHRPDLAGLPFVMGKACRLTQNEHEQMSEAVVMVHASLGPPKENAPAKFWKFYDTMRENQGQWMNKTPPQGRFRVAALMQILAIESPELRSSLAARLPDFEKNAGDKEAVSKALTRLALFSPEAEVRRAAGDALAKRNDPEPITAVLQQGLRYPWPAVAQHAAETIVKLKRQDLVPELIRLLDELDPRAPVSQDIKGEQGSLTPGPSPHSERGEKVPVVRELVRINHMRNCLLCHPPANAFMEHGKERTLEAKKALNLGRGRHGNVVFGAPLAGGVPVPGHSLEQADVKGSRYGSQSPDILVRADITYLQQDFSLMQEVADADPWPTMQRFDFLVRRRVLTEEEANVYRAEFAKREATSPYREAALAALRQLTGQDAGATAQAWRTALKLKSE